jgi:hypothetical protein
MKKVMMRVKVKSHDTDKKDQKKIPEVVTPKFVISTDKDGNPAVPPITE